MMLYSKVAPNGADTFIVPFALSHIGCVTATVGVAGIGFTVTVIVAVFVQPLPSVPVTVYVFVADGVNGVLFVTLLFQLYVLAPVPDKATMLPPQILVAVAVAPTFGKAFTVTVIVAVFVQPFEPVPVTVYVAVAVGINDVPFVTLLFHVYVLAPPPVKVTALPAHTAAAVVFAVTVGFAFTVTVTLDVAVQPLPSVPVTV